MIIDGCDDDITDCTLGMHITLLLEFGAGFAVAVKLIMSMWMPNETCLVIMALVMRSCCWDIHGHLMQPGGSTNMN